MNDSAPSYESRNAFDLQVNGFAGLDFNGDELDPELLESACKKLLADGVSNILATVITASLHDMAQRIQNVCRARESSATIRQVIAGIHIEGPFISREPGYVGAHPVEHTLDANLDALKRLLDAAEGIAKIVTLAPEVDKEFKFTKYLKNRNVTVAAGHCDPKLRTLEAAIDAGVSMFTHLGNGCPIQMHRHDNIIQRALSFSDRLVIGFIADGIHVPFHALRNYLDVTGFDKAFVVTDCISAAGCGPGTFQLGNQSVIVDDNFATWSADGSHLVGSALTMPDVIGNLRRQLGLTEEEIIRLTETNPRKAIGLEETDDHS
ncbi:MAG: N-acetylglucosamine-6-phosphate deacetylase [Mariniblastus sp.]